MKAEDEGEMAWEETVLKPDELADIFRRVNSTDALDYVKPIMEAQAEATWDAAFDEGYMEGVTRTTEVTDSTYGDMLEGVREQARFEGRREVVGWVQSHHLIEPSPDSITRFAPFYQIKQAALKEWGVE